MGSTCSAQMITFRVITDQGKPIKKRSVSISFDGLKNGKPIGRGQTQETDENGEARFTLPPSGRDFFFFYVDLGSPYWFCGCDGIPKIQDVVQRGIVQSAARKDPSKSFEPKPGEVLIVARKFSFIDRLLYPFMKD